MLLEWLFGKPCKTHLCASSSYGLLKRAGPICQVINYFNKEPRAEFSPLGNGTSIGVYFNSMESMMEIVNQLSNCDPLGWILFCSLVEQPSQ